MKLKIDWHKFGSGVAQTPRKIIEWSTNFLEFLTDHLHTSLAHIMIKASPLLAPAPSAIAIYGALASRFGHGAAGVMTFVFEALGFAAVYAKTKLDEHNRQAQSDKLPTDKADWAIGAYFVVTELSIILFEVVPAWAKYAATPQGERDIVTALIHTAPIVFPIFSYIGANIYSLMDVLAGMGERARAKSDETLTDLQTRLSAVMAELKEQRERHQNEIAELRKAHEARLAEAQTGRTQAEGLARDLERTVVRLERDIAILETKLSMLDRTPTTGAEPLRLVAKAEPSGISASERRGEVLRALTQTASKDEVNFAELGRTFGTSDTTIRNDLKWLIENGYWSNGSNWKALPKASELLGEIMVRN